jgi:hypothetical protein
MSNQRPDRNCLNCAAFAPAEHDEPAICGNDLELLGLTEPCHGYLTHAELDESAARSLHEWVPPMTGEDTPKPRPNRDSRAEALAKSNAVRTIRPPLSTGQLSALAAIRQKHRGISTDTQRSRLLEAIERLGGITQREAIDHLCITNPSDCIKELRCGGAIHCEPVHYMDRDGQFRRTKLYTLSEVTA